MNFFGRKKKAHDCSLPFHQGAESSKMVRAWKGEGKEKGEKKAAESVVEREYRCFCLHHKSGYYRWGRFGRDKCES
jgi:hypothetical protein